MLYRKTGDTDCYLHHSSPLNGLSSLAYHSASFYLSAVENFIVSARKYRPATFETVVGQSHITSTLKNAIRSNQLAQAFLFCGPRGVGKTTCARILAKTINCQSLTAESEACGTCDSCKSFQNGNSFNIHELDAASNNSVDDIRSLIEQVRIPPQAGKYKIYIIDEVHMLSQAAFNAFLKTLEEPPAYAIFILATTEKHKILPTILSRCQIFDFNRIRVEDMAAHLASIAHREGISADADGLHLIAQKADGGLRDALSMFDQIVSFSNRNLTYKSVISNLNILDHDYYFRVTDFLLTQNLAQALLVFDEILNSGFDGNNFINGLSSHFRNLLVCKDPATLRLLDVSEGTAAKYKEQAEKASVSFLLSALNVSNQCDLNYKLSKNQRLLVELSLIKICHIPSALNLTASGGPEAQKKKTDTLGSSSHGVPATTAAATAIPDQVQPQRKSQNAPVPSAAPAAIPVPAPEAAASVAANSAIPKPKITIKPLNAGKSLIPNLNDIDKPKVEEEDKGPQYIKGELSEAYSEARFMQEWNAYAEQMRRESKINMYTLLTANAPKLLGNDQIEVLTENKIQENLLNVEKIDLLNFLRVQLRNFKLDIAVRQIEKSEKKRLYTAHEKFEHMAQKNPQLEEIRRRFNLEIE